MNKKIVFKIFMVLIITTILSTNYAYAYGHSDKSIWTLGKEWLSLGENERANSVLDDGANDGFEEIAGLLWGAGIFIIAIIGVILGIRYMISPPEEKANLKKMLIPYLIGTVMILGAAGIWKVIVDLLDKIAQGTRT